MHYSLAILLVLLTSCQPALKPFSHLGKTPSKLVELTDGKGIMVIPVIDSNGRRLDLLTNNMVKALIEQNVPAAYYSGNRSSFILDGHFRKKSDVINLTWTLWTPEGNKIGEVIQSAFRSTKSIDNYTKFSNVALSAKEIATFVQKDEIANVSLPAIYVASVSGSTKKANLRLHQAIEKAFKKIGVKFISKPEANSLVLKAFIEVNSPSNNKKYIKITSIINDNTGAQIATITQSHKLIDKNFEKKWNFISDEAALACAASIKELIKQIDWGIEHSNK